MVNQRVYHFAGIGVPDAHGAVRGAGDNGLVVVLQTEHRARVTGEHFYALQCVSVPNLYCVVAQTRDDLLIVVLQAVYALGVLAATVYLVQIEATGAPIVVDTVDVAHDAREQLAIEGVMLVTLAGLGLEQEFYPGKREGF